MSKEQRISSHTVSCLTVHLVWVTKYRYKVLTGYVQIRTEQVILGPSFLGKWLRRQELSAWSGTGNITDEMVNDYLERHRKSGNIDTDNIILE